MVSFMRDLYCIWPHISENARGLRVEEATRFSFFEKATFRLNNMAFRPQYLLTTDTDVHGAHLRPAWFSL